MRIHRIKSFRFSIIRAPITVPPVVVTDFTAEQAVDFREQFKPLAAHYRRRLRWMVWSIVAAVAACVALAHLLPDTLTVFCFLGGVASFLLIGVVFWPTLPPCPACRRQLDNTVGMFCPECGSPSVQPGGWFKPPGCSSCGKGMNSARGRKYKIRACTHCGVMLDEKGL